MAFKTQADIEQRKEAEHEVIKQFQQTLLHKAVWRSCLNCDMFSETQGKCTKFNALPPPHVIVNGCKDWEDDIPF
jgi:hypothetical protein